MKKTFLLIMMVLSVLNIAAFASCLIYIENKEEKYMISIWKHTEDQNDDVKRYFLGQKDLQEIDYLLSRHKNTTFLFNGGSFTKVRYDNGDSAVWGRLNDSEKEMVHFIENKFDVREK